MGLSAGARFGPYEIVGLLGAGGMGEVYRARDARLAREVAVKVLPASFASDADMLRRFEQEARAAGGLNHPNILAIFDVGAQEGAPYVVSELLEGETLRVRLAEGPLSQRKAIDYTLQVAQGLAAAHEKGIVHRDLKPENLFVTRDERIKILDFGLAKLAPPALTGGEETGSLQLESPGTRAGTVLGTVGYMSPEQVRAKPTDHRSDIFSFGAVLYEMLAGQRAFRGESAVEVLNAVLKDDPSDLGEAKRGLSPALDRIVRRCLEKRPEQRFQSIADVAFALEAISGLTSASTTAGPALPAPRRLVGLWPALAGAAILLAAVAGSAFLAGQRTVSPSSPTFHRLTFQRGTVFAARFAPDGRTVVYSAAWGGRPLELFSVYPGTADARALGVTKADLFSISPSGELALCRGRSSRVFGRAGTLARVPLAGGAPRDVLEDVREADWLPDGSSLAVARRVEGGSRIELPLGTKLLDVQSHLSFLRVSPRGDAVAFVESEGGFAPAESVVVVDTSGKKRSLTTGWLVNGLAWSPRGDEVWFTASRGLTGQALYAVSFSGKERLVLRGSEGLELHDIARDGRVLLAGFSPRTTVMCLPPGASAPLDLSWLEGSQVASLSADGRTVLFSEMHEGGGPKGSAYLRRTDGGLPVRLGDGDAQALSPDGKWAVVTTRTSPQDHVLLPTGPGEPRVLPRGDITYESGATWLPDGKRILFSGREPGKQIRGYAQDVETGAIRPITPEGVNISGAVTPDGRYVVSSGGAERKRHPIDGGEPRPLPDLERQLVLRWSADGKALFVQDGRRPPVRVFRVDADGPPDAVARADASRSGGCRPRLVDLPDTGRTLVRLHRPAVPRRPLPRRGPEVTLPPLSRVGWRQRVRSRVGSPGRGGGRARPASRGSFPAGSAARGLPRR